MGARAIVEWHQDDNDAPVLIQRNPWLSPSTFLPALADFVHAAREGGHAPSAERFRGWAAERTPYLLGQDEPRDRMMFLQPGSDVQFHYLIQLDEGHQPAGRVLRVTAREKEPFRTRVGGRWEITHQATTDDELFELAAGILRQQAARIRRLAAEGRGGPMPPADEVAARAERIRARSSRLSRADGQARAAARSVTP
ncbi:hypothetical protein ACFVIM_30710 [Streptomyces sp. NPDC057638]|uniref:hypothetical protein n=1 Tax=Streptomyces sp. NPDC057638 TaxID=3346190 RepID=UPI00368EA93F